MGFHGTFIHIWVSMGRNLPQCDPQRSVWDEIPCAETHKGHGDLQRKPYGTIQDETPFAKSHKGYRVRRCGLIILTRDDGVLMWCIILNNYLRVPQKETIWDGMAFPAQEPIRETVWTIWVNKILYGIPCGVRNSPVVNIVTEGWRTDRTPCSQVNCSSECLYPVRAIRVRSVRRVQTAYSKFIIYI